MLASDPSILPPGLVTGFFGQKTEEALRKFQRKFGIGSSGFFGPLSRQFFKEQCKDTDQACAALLKDLKQRGLLDDTLVIWAGEFGRTVYSQGTLTRTNYGRDHHPRCFTLWMAGGGIKGGQVYGETDEMSYNIVKDPVHIRDLHATILHLLGLGHQSLIFEHNSREERLTDVYKARVIQE